MNLNNKFILVFVHIEKAAGTTFNYILRKNFLFRHYEVRPFSIQSRKIFQPNDFKLALTINPFIKSISGHSISPTVNLTNIYPNLRYITLLRDPIKRYVSHFWYWIKRLKRNLTFEDFLQIEDLWNFQTKKIAVCENLEIAKEILKNKFWLVGIVEEFDEFLLILKNKLLPLSFDPLYRKENVGLGNKKYRYYMAWLIEKYSKDIIQRNKIDLQLYEFVKENFYQEKQNYSSVLKKELLDFRDKLSSYKWPISIYLDFIYRKLYIDIVTGIIRKKRGLPYKGSY